MRSKSRWAPVALATLVIGISSSARAGYGITFGNHEGGLIPWTPEVQTAEGRSVLGQIMVNHCAAYNREAYVTGIVPGYGNYISFRCRFHPAYDPMKGIFPTQFQR
jgi:hypothetical protein